MTYKYSELFILALLLSCSFFFSVMLLFFHALRCTHAWLDIGVPQYTNQTISATVLHCSLLDRNATDLHTMRYKLHSTWVCNLICCKAD